MAEAPVPPEEHDYYADLGVSKSAVAEEINAAYKKLALQHHPDKTGDKSKRNLEAFYRIQTAYECLRSPYMRKLYDHEHDRIRQKWTYYHRNMRTYELQLDGRRRSEEEEAGRHAVTQREDKTKAWEKLLEENRVWTEQRNNAIFKGNEQHQASEKKYLFETESGEIFCYCLGCIGRKERKLQEGDPPDMPILRIPDEDYNAFWEWKKEEDAQRKQREEQEQKASEIRARRVRKKDARKHKQETAERERCEKKLQQSAAEYERRERRLEKKRREEKDKRDVKAYVETKKDEYMPMTRLARILDVRRRPGRFGM
ncbi:DnaJ-domain-containing protein [Massarina eburnea CBS 473.64]|uniref:DnaJ-domain-containing protein n=1 Tax=Massarina eburnea CBS 473.64 TaxID=1395130 RepID=A0A6A6S422_9PLEO|nr:DnaJ-domain-containing protein [Massarina eburnea CBS 473.64]